MHFWFNLSEIFWKKWPQVEKNGTFLRFYIPKYLAEEDVTVHALAGNKSSGDFVEIRLKKTQKKCCSVEQKMCVNKEKDKTSNFSVKLLKL